MGPSRLPVPNLPEDNLQYSYKQISKRFVRRPPKLKPRCNTSLGKTNSSIALSISFRHDGNSEASFTPLENESDSFSNESYFDRCFTQLEKIGEGSFGEVFKVRSKQDGLLYAVKMSKDTFRHRQERLEEVRRYEEFSGQANFVQFYKAWEQDDKLFMQMELCRESLEQYLERCRYIPESKIWSILLDLSLGLKSLHDRNLIHLDIKLDNILISDDESCKLADFGLVVDVDLANRRDTPEGDSRYMAPELLDGKFSKAADIFSLGIAMLELASNLELPSNGPLWQNLRNGNLPEPFISHLSYELVTLLKEMMTPNYSARPTVDQLLSHKRLSSIMKRRNNFRVITKLKTKFRRSRQIAWSNLCNIKSLIDKLLKHLKEFFGLLELKPIRLNSSNNHLIKNINNNSCNEADLSFGNQSYNTSSMDLSTPVKMTSNGRSMHLDENWLENSQSETPRFENANIFKSTPVNHNCRSRKDLKTSFISNDMEDADFHYLSLIESRNIDSLGLNRDCFADQRNDTFPLLGKKLFLALEETD